MFFVKALIWRRIETFRSIIINKIAWDNNLIRILNFDETSNYDIFYLTNLLIGMTSFSTNRSKSFFRPSNVCFGFFSHNRNILQVYQEIAQWDRSKWQFITLHAVFYSKRKSWYRLRNLKEIKNSLSSDVHLLSTSKYLRFTLKF